MISRLLWRLPIWALWLITGWRMVNLHPLDANGEKPCDVRWKYSRQR
jgi:hypothetical protein